MNELPFGLSFPAPAYVDAIPISERGDRVSVDGDLCEIDGEHFFIRARVQLPVSGGGADAPVFEWRVWANVGAAQWVRLAEALEQPEVELPPPSIGFVASRLPDYPDTLDLRGQIHAQPGALPLLVLTDGSHPLSIEQTEGISIERVRAFMNEAKR